MILDKSPISQVLFPKCFQINHMENSNKDSSTEAYLKCSKIRCSRFYHEVSIFVQTRDPVPLERNTKRSLDAQDHLLYRHGKPLTFKLTIHAILSDLSKLL
jgi:hypothetical protein